MKGLKIIGFIFFKVAIIALYVFIVMHLWNWLMPDIFGITTLTFWQTLGVLLLCKLLFLGSGWGGYRGKFKGRRGRPSREPWENGIKQRLRERCKNHKTNNDEQ